MKVKIFSSNSLSRIEKGLNDWLATEGILLIKILQSESGATEEDWYLTITIFYEEAVA